MQISQKIDLEIRESRGKLLSLGVRGDALTPDEKTEFESLPTEIRAKEAKYRAKVLEEDAAAVKAAADLDRDGGDPEVREKIELRSKARGEGLLTSQLSGHRPDGARAEYLAAHGCGDRTIPFDYWTKPQVETRALTPPPSTGSGVNLDPIQPHVFAAGLAATLGITLKMVDSGQFSTATITTALLATAKAKSAAADATAGAMTATTSGVKRISASVTMAEEDVASVGQANYESALMAHAGLALQNGHDTYALTGTGSAPAPKGLLLAIGAVATRSTEETFASYAAVPADAVDGIFAREMNDVFSSVWRQFVCTRRENHSGGHRRQRVRVSPRGGWGLHGDVSLSRSGQQRATGACVSARPSWRANSSTADLEPDHD